MENLVTNLPLKSFQDNLLSQSHIIEEKEVHILFALSDLLPEQSNNDDYIKNSLSFLKTNFNLTKGVWKVLLKLYDKIPNFTIILSDWGKETPFTTSLRLTKEMWMHTFIPHPNLPFYFEHRKNSIQSLFLIIDSLLSHISTEEICEIMPLISKSFDYKQSPFYTKNLINNNITKHQIKILDSFFPKFGLYYTLKNISDNFYYPFNRSTPKNYNAYINNLILRLGKLDIESTPFNAKEIQSLTIETYNKYTQYPYPAYQGFEEIKKTIVNEDDKFIIDILLKTYEKSFQTSQAHFQAYIYLMKIFCQNKNAFNKFDQITDYLYMSNDYYLKFEKNPNYKIKDLFTWCNYWHNNGEHLQDFIGEKKEFKNFDINHQIEDYNFVQITNNYDLYLEGKNQKHCVFNYKEACLKDTIIVSMRDKEGNITSTLRFQSYPQKSFLFIKNKTKIELVENRKKMNKECSVYEKQIAKQYFNLIRDKVHF